MFKSVGLFVSGAFAGVCINIFLTFPPADSSAWASWMQAFGALLAVGAAIFVMDNQMRHQRIEAKNEQANLILAAIMFGTETTSLFEAMEKAIGEEAAIDIATARYSLQRLEQAVIAGNRMPLWKMGIDEAKHVALLHTGARNAMASLHVLIEHLNGIPRSPNDLLGTSIVASVTFSAYVRNTLKRGRTTGDKAINDLRGRYGELTGNKVPF